MRIDLETEAIAKALLRGEQGAVETCWLLAARQNLEQLLRQEDLDFISAVQSETDALPVGEYAANWHPDFVQAKLDELARYNKQTEAQTKEVCERILQQIESVRTRTQ